MVFTNRQSYQALAMVFVVLLNVVWAAANRFLVRQVVPGLEAALMAKATGAADVDAQSGKKARRSRARVRARQSERGECASAGEGVSYKVSWFSTARNHATITMPTLGISTRPSIPDASSD